jgi:probable HAF family extracellular repeat protein
VRPLDGVTGDGNAGWMERGRAGTSRRRLTLAGLMAISAPAVVRTTTYRIADLGTLPGTTQSEAYAINDAGAIAGYCASESTFATTLAFSWQSGTLRSLGKLPQGNYSLGRAINSQGVIGGEGDTGDWLPKVWIARNGALFDLDQTGGVNIRMVAVTDGGPVVANLAKGLSGNGSLWRPVIYTEDPTGPGRFNRVSLPIVAGGDSNSQTAYANAANNLQQVVGSVQNSVIGQQAAFWNNDAAHSVTVLSPLPGGWKAIAYGINDFGEIVGESYAPFVSTAVLWQGASLTPVSLGTLPGDLESTAAAINLSGQIIGTSIASDDTRRGFVWQGGVMIDLTAALDATGAGWTIDMPYAINSLGEIAGSGWLNGARRAFVMMPN